MCLLYFSATTMKRFKQLKLFLFCRLRRTSIVVAQKLCLKRETFDEKLRRGNIFIKFMISFLCFWTLMSWQILSYAAKCEIDERLWTFQRTIDFIKRLHWQGSKWKRLSLFLVSTKSEFLEKSILTKTVVFSSAFLISLLWSKKIPSARKENRKKR